MDVIMEIIRTGVTAQSLTSILVIVSLVVEKLPGKIKPWSVALRWVGKLLNASLSEQIRGLESTAEENKKKINTLSVALAEHRAMSWRMNILNFAENLRLGLERTDSQFDLAIKDIGEYERYCDEHNIPNHVIDEAKSYILTRYREQKNI